MGPKHKTPKKNLTSRRASQLGQLQWSSDGEMNLGLVLSCGLKSPRFFMPFVQTSDWDLELLGCRNIRPQYSNYEGSLSPKHIDPKALSALKP